MDNVDQQGNFVDECDLADTVLYDVTSFESNWSGRGGTRRLKYDEISCLKSID